jgi:hypothetical protein
MVDDGWMGVVDLLCSALLFTSFIAFYLLFTGLAGRGILCGLGPWKDSVVMYVHQRGLFFDECHDLSGDGWDGGDGGRVSWKGIELWRQYSTHMATWYLRCIISPGYIKARQSKSVFFVDRHFLAVDLLPRCFGWQ